MPTNPYEAPKEVGGESRSRRGGLRTGCLLLLVTAAVVGCSAFGYYIYVLSQLRMPVPFD